MNIAFVGCGFVFDLYMRTMWAHPELNVSGVYDIDLERAATVGQHYGFQVYPDFESLLNDPNVRVVVNLTNIRSHYSVTKRALEAGKHVYSEKPLTADLVQTRDLFAVAEARRLVLTGAPCDIYSDSARTLWKAVRDGAIGKPVLVYAELDDNPAHLMNFEEVRSPTGAPFPYVEEFQEGCTFEHVAYHLTWICAILGPAVSVTAFSKRLIDQKTDTPLSPDDTPDFSVACLKFANGAVARVTCSIVAPRDLRQRIIGEEGEVWADCVFHHQSPVRLERFSTVSLAARKARSARTHPCLGQVFGVGGRKLPFVSHWKSHAVERSVGPSLKQRLVSWLRRREIYSQDKLLGIAEMRLALKENRPQPMTPEFLMHINELTLMIHGAGSEGVATTPATTFSQIELPEGSNDKAHNYRRWYRPRLFERLLGGAIETLHK